MDGVPETRDSLLVRVRNPDDRDAWEQFADIYRPVVYRLARGRGLQDADAQDLTQRVMVSIANAVPTWKRSTPGSRFRHWLRRVARNEVLKVLTRQPKDVAGGGTTAVERMNQHPETSPDLDDEETREYRRQLIRRAAEVVRARADESTWLAFSLTMVDGLSIADAATRLGKTEGVIYAARSRIVRRLREVIRQWEDEENE